MAAKRKSSAVANGRGARSNQTARRVVVRETRQERAERLAREARNARRRELYAIRRAAEIEAARLAEERRLERNRQRRERYAAEREAERLAALAAERARRAKKAAKKAPVPAKKAPAKKAPVPAKKAPVPAKKAPVPAKKAPAKKAPVPAKKAPVPAKKPAKNAPVPAKKPTKKAPSKKPAKAPQSQIEPVDVNEIVTPFDHWHTALLEHRDRHRNSIRDKFTIRGREKAINFRRIVEEYHDNGKYSYHMVIEVRALIMDSTVQSIMETLKGPVDYLYQKANIRGDSSAYASLRLTEYTTSIVGSPDPTDFMADGDDEDSVFMQTWKSTQGRTNKEEFYFSIWQMLSEIADESARGASFLEYVVVRLYDEG